MIEIRSERLPYLTSKKIEKTKGAFPMKENFLKKLSGLFFVMMLIFSVGALGFGTKAHAVDKPTEGKLFIHKLKFDGVAPEDIPSIAGDGTQIETPPGAPSPGIKFAVFSMEGSGLSLNPNQKDVLDYYATIKDNPAIAQDAGQTNSEGVFETKTLPAGKYVVVELLPEVGTYSMAAPVVVDIPMMKTDGTGWNNNIHLYTKSGVTLGAAKIRKLDSDNQALPGVKFSLYRKEAPGTPDFLVEKDLISGDDGYTDIVGNLVIGDYYFVETSPLDSYLLNGAQVPFSISISNDAYNATTGKLELDKVITKDLVNYLKPTLTKTRMTKDNTDVGKIVTWKISTDVPLNLKEYKKYVVTDTLDNRLSYIGNLTVKLDNATLNPDLYNVNISGNEIKVSFTDIFAEGNIGAITKGKKFNIQFDTIVNNTAVPGEKIPNNAVLAMNNGWVDATSTEVNPPMVETGGRKFVKVNANNDPLAGAEFVVSKKIGENEEQEGENVVYMKQSANKSVTWVDSKAEATVFTSAADGSFETYGLAYGNYFIEEIKAPKGYNLLNGVKAFTVTPTSYLDNAKILVVNTTAPVIPITGGIGTLIFFAIGLTLMGIVYFFYRRYENQTA